MAHSHWRQRTNAVLLAIFYEAEELANYLRLDEDGVASGRLSFVDVEVEEGSDLPGRQFLVLILGHDHLLVLGVGGVEVEHDQLGDLVVVRL